MSNVKKRLNFDFDQGNPVITIKQAPKQVPLVWPEKFKFLMNDPAVVAGLNYPWYEIHGTSMVQIPEPQMPTVKPASQSTVPVQPTSTAQTLRSSVMPQVPSSTQRSIPRSAQSQPSIAPQPAQQPMANSETMQIDVAPTVERGIGGVEVHQHPSQTIQKPPRFTLGGGELSQDWARLRSEASDSVKQLRNQLDQYDQRVFQAQKKQRQRLNQVQQELTNYQKAAVQKRRQLRSSMADVIAFAQQNALAVMRQAKQHHAQVKDAVIAALNDEGADGSFSTPDELRSLEAELSQAGQQVKQTREKGSQMVKQVQFQFDQELVEFDDSVAAKVATLSSQLSQRQSQLHDFDEDD